ncbi:MAG: hypothetical protein AAF551_12115 [Bacteroidota bacterium]
MKKYHQVLLVTLLSANSFLYGQYSDLKIDNQLVIDTDANNILMGDLASGDGLRGFSLWSGDRERIFINQNGNVGVGTNDPIVKLDIRSSLWVGANASDGLFISNNLDRYGVGVKNVLIETQNSVPLQIRASGDADLALGSTSEVMRLKGEGNVGVGTTYPQGKLHLHKQENAVNVETVDLVLSQFNGVSKISGLYTGTHKGGIAFSTNNGTLGDMNEHMRITSSGNVGLGTSTPFHKLQIEDGLNMKIGAGTHTGEPAFFLSRWTGGGDNYQSVILHSLSNNTDYGLAFSTTEGTHLDGDYSGYSPKMYLTQSGNLGIGTTNPSYKLEVFGTIRAKEIRCEAAPWPDYVFEEDYELPSIESIEQFIKSEKHLPEMPTAEEVAADGVALGEMNRLLVQKVEELTLYLIEANKEKEALQETVTTQGAELTAQRLQLKAITEQLESINLKLKNQDQ